MSTLKAEGARLVPAAREEEKRGCAPAASPESGPSDKQSEGSPYSEVILVNLDFADGSFETFLRPKPPRAVSRGVQPDRTRAKFNHLPPRDTRYGYIELYQAEGKKKEASA